MPSPFEIHKRRWVNCKRCPLHEHRLKVCLVRGKLPADVLFIGEAPGVSEDTLGYPFKGPAGKLLDRIIVDAMPPRPVVDDEGKVRTVEVRYAITNLIGCIPRDDEGLKAGEPPKYAIEACAPRLKEIFELARPRLVVMVGRFSEKYSPKTLGIAPDMDHVFGKKKMKVKLLSVIHPAAILRMDQSQKGLAVQRTRVALADAVDALFGV